MATHAAGATSIIRRHFVSGCNLGLAFKPNTDDIRESKAIPIVEQLLKEKAHIKAYDPKAIKNFKKIYPNIIYCHSAQDILSSEAILILTKWDEFKKLDYKGKIVIDGRKLLLNEFHFDEELKNKIIKETEDKIIYMGNLEEVFKKRDGSIYKS